MNQSLIKVREYFGERTSVIFGNSLLTYGTTCMTHCITISQAGSRR